MSVARLFPRFGRSGASPSWQSWLLKVSLIGLAYYLAGRVGLAVPQLVPQVSLVWPCAGIALAALLRWGAGMWPGIALAAFGVAHATGASPWLCVALAFGNTAGPAAGAWLLRYVGLHTALQRPQDILVFVALGAVATPLVTATHGAAWLVAGDIVSSTALASAWLYWWLGDAMGVLVVGIPLLTAGRLPTSPAAMPWRQYLRTALPCCLVLAGGALLFMQPPSADGVLSPFIFLPHLLLCWLAMRSNLFTASLAVLALSAGAATATTLGVGPLARGSLPQSMTLLWIYAGTLSAIPLLVTGLIGEMMANDRHWQLALESSNIGVAKWRVEPDEILLSPRWLDLLGYRTQTFGRSGNAIWSRVHDEDRTALRQSLLPLASGMQAAGPFDFRMQRHDGSWLWLQGHAILAEAYDDGRPLQIVMTVRDTTAQRAAEEKHLLSSKLFEHLHEGLLITDGNYRALDANPKFTEITGYARTELLGTVPPLLRPAPAGSIQATQQALLAQGLRERDAWRGEMTLRHRNGENHILQVTISAVKAGNGALRFYALALSDITQARKQLEQLQRQAHFDELTGLPNRVRLADLLRDALADSEREGFLLTVCYLDLDHFKAVNDKFGHAVGDFLLMEMAERLRSSVRHRQNSKDVVARLGGDEFVLLLRTATLEESRRAVERILRNVSSPYGLGLGAGPLVVTSSIGATVYPIDDADADTLLRHADHAMYGAKQSGRNGFLFFDAEHDRRTEAHFEALGRVQEALEAEQFVLYYQPKVDMHAGRVLGVEALLRWKHPDHGVIPPAQFLPLIEHTSLSEQVGDWVLKNGIDQLARWQRMGLDLTVSINVSARHLQQPLFSKRLAALLDRHQTPVAHRLILEVLETAALVDVDYTCRLMEECKELGVRFALDDFGTGYSTLTYLKRLPLDLLKIDRSFVHNMLSDAQDMAIVDGVIGLSRTFGCTVVAEGVESAEQALRLMEAGCHVGQGNGIAKAMPAEDVFLWVKNYKGAPLDQTEQRPLAALG